MKTNTNTNWNWKWKWNWNLLSYFWLATLALAIFASAAIAAPNRRERSPSVRERVQNVATLEPIGFDREESRYLKQASIQGWTINKTGRWSLIWRANADRKARYYRDIETRDLRESQKLTLARITDRKAALSERIERLRPELKDVRFDSNRERIYDAGDRNSDLSRVSARAKYLNRGELVASERGSDRLSTRSVRPVRQRERRDVEKRLASNRSIRNNRPVEYGV